MASDRSHEQANDRERARLVALSNRPASDLGRDVGGGWTVAVAVAHVAFWDRFAHERLKVWLRDGTFVPVSLPLIETLNEALLPQWLALPPGVVARDFLQATEALDREISGLSDDVIERYRAALAPGQAPLFLDRSKHRDEHVRQIEAVIG